MGELTHDRWTVLLNEGVGQSGTSIPNNGACCCAP